MPRKPPVIEENPPVDSSEEEEEEEEEEEQNDAVNEDGEEEQQQKQETPVKKSTVNSSSSDDDSESDADSEETQPSPAASAFTIKPRGDADAAAATSMANKKTTASKRKAIVEETESKNDNKKNKKAKAAAAGSNGRGGGEPRGREGKVQRLWTEDDEIALLKGTSEYRSIKGSDPSADVGGFYEYIKKSLDLSFELSKPQMVDKIYRLKKKYKANVEKAGDDDPVFAKPHEQRAFELSKKIWGPEAVVLNGVGVDAKKSKNLKTKQARPPLPVPSIGVTLGLPNRKNPNFHPEKKANVRANGEVEMEAEAEAEVEADAEVGDGEENGGKVGSDIWSKFPHLGLSLDMEKALAWPEFEKSFVREQMSLIGSNKAKELEETWRDLQEKELELYLKKIDVVKQQAQLALDVLRASRY